MTKKTLQEKIDETDWKRRKGVVEKVSIDNDHDTLYLVIDFGGTQGFGGLCGLGRGTELRQDFVAQLCRLFHVSGIEETVGKPCWVLFAFGRNNETIEGLENESGERFTLTAFRKKHWPGEEASPLENERKRLQNERASHLRCAREAEQLLAQLDAKFTDWETAPLGPSKPSPTT